MEKLGNVLINVLQDLSRISTNGEAHIRINKNICDAPRFKTLFNYFTQGTILEHIKLEVEEIEAKAQCICGYEEIIRGEHKGYLKCPDCGKFAEVRDEPYEITNPHPDKTQKRETKKF